MAYRRIFIYHSGTNFFFHQVLCTRKTETKNEKESYSVPRYLSIDKIQLFFFFSSTWKTLLKRMEKNKEGISDRRDKTDKHDYHVREIGCKVNRIRFSGSSVERRRVSGLFRKLVRQRGWSGDARRFNLPISNAATDRVA